MKTVNEFQYRLVKAIEQNDVTAADLVRMTGIDKSAISNYINGVYVPKYDKVCRLAEALHVDPNYLMSGEEPPATLQLDKTERSIVLSYRAAAEAIKYAVRALLKIDEE